MDKRKKIMAPAGFKPMTLPLELRFSEECSSKPLPSTHFTGQMEVHANSW